MQVRMCEQVELTLRGIEKVQPLWKQLEQFPKKVKYAST